MLPVQEDGHDRSASPNFWLWRCSSAPVPTLLTAGGDSCAHDGNEVEILPVFSRECSGEDSRSEIPVKSSSNHDEYPSDKENWELGNMRRTSGSWDGRQSCRPSNKEEDRQPFTGLQADSKWLKPLFSSPLASSPDSDIGPRSRASGLRPPQQPSSSVLVNNLDSLFGKLKLGELRCQWPMVVDTNCLLDTDALKSLKQLEGIRETRIIVPQIGMDWICNHLAERLSPPVF